MITIKLRNYRSLRMASPAVTGVCGALSASHTLVRTSLERISRG